MKIRNVSHKGLRRFIEQDDAAGLQPAVVPRLRRMLSFLQDMEREEELYTVPGWRAHRLAGDRKGVWSLSVTKNWRMTFRIDPAGRQIVDLDYEDCH
ncbi:MAG: type II toxin-antitoxin system RelE/ParE family toxin [Rhodospirillaceae bacterium]|nr:type II toxin-antitoxin system RelE/ParE family toxin [Rhodospirillaceae bacterium]MCY4066955.1 type II toxin-antitoxin system RelE/ParE family toxin [Rhodospirillaceae bacterium]